MLTMYYSFIYPYLNYCIHVWGASRKTYLNKVILLQKKAVRIISGADRLAHTELLFRSLAMLNIDKIYSYNVGLMMFKFHHEKLPLILKKFFTKNCAIHSYNTRQKYLLHIPRFDKEVGKRSFRLRAAISWNHLLQNLNSLDIRISTFKTHLKQYLIVHNESIHESIYTRSS